MSLTINGFKVGKDAILQEAQRLTEEVNQQFPWLDPIARKLQAEDMAKDRIIEHRLLFEESRKQIEELTTDEVESEFNQIAKKHGGRKRFPKEIQHQPK